MSDPYVVADKVAWVDAEDLGKERAAVYVARIPQGPPIVLEGPAWAVWTAVTEGVGGDDEVVARVTDLTGLGADEVGPDVRAFLADLLAQGLLARQASRDD